MLIQPMVRLEASLKQGSVPYGLHRMRAMNAMSRLGNRQEKLASPLITSAPTLHLPPPPPPPTVSPFLPPIFSFHNVTSYACTGKAMT